MNDKMDQIMSDIYGGRTRARVVQPTLEDFVEKWKERTSFLCSILGDNDPQYRLLRDVVTELERIADVFNRERDDFVHLAEVVADPTSGMNVQKMAKEVLEKYGY